jgi:hypothetical protein
MEEMSPSRDEISSLDGYGRVVIPRRTCRLKEGGWYLFGLENRPVSLFPFTFTDSHCDL